MQCAAFLASIRRRSRSNPGGKSPEQVNKVRFGRLLKAPGLYVTNCYARLNLAISSPAANTMKISALHHGNRIALTIPESSFRKSARQVRHKNHCTIAADDSYRQHRRRASLWFPGKRSENANIRWTREKKITLLGGE